MFQLNLFHEQQQLQRERDLDPVRLTVLGGLLALLGILIYAGGIYMSMGGLRTELASKRVRLGELDKELKNLGALTDLGRIQSQAQSLQDRLEHRTLFANQLDILCDVIPTNCQVRAFRTQRGINVTEVVTKGRKADVVVKKATPTLNLFFEVETREKSKLEVLETRNRLKDVLAQCPRLREWTMQSVEIDEGGATNNLNQVEIVNSVAQDPRGSDLAVGIFEYKIPIALKDEPQEM